MPRRAAAAVSRSPGALHGHLKRCPIKVAIGLLLTIGSGAPTEGYGVSNNRTYALSAPRWGESQFLLAVGEARTVPVTLRN